LIGIWEMVKPHVYCVDAKKRALSENMFLLDVESNDALFGTLLQQSNSKDKSSVRRPSAKRTITLLLAFLCALQIVHAEVMVVRGGLISDGQARKSAGGFSVQLIFVHDVMELSRIWLRHPDLQSVKLADNVPVLGEINALIVVGGCKTDSAGKCNVTSKYDVLRPDGEAYANPSSLTVWKEKPEPRQDSLLLSTQFVKITIEKTDQLGEYTVFARVTDQNSGVTVQVDASFLAYKVDQ
jgi:hypothetical protein